MTKDEALRIDTIIETLEICANYDDSFLKNRNELIMKCAKRLSEIISSPIDEDFDALVNETFSSMYKDSKAKLKKWPHDLPNLDEAIMENK